MQSVESQRARLAGEEADAWYEYLETIRCARSPLNHFNYEEVESWAWLRLTDRLGKIAKRQARLDHREERLERRSA